MKDLKMTVVLTMFIRSDSEFHRESWHLSLIGGYLMVPFVSEGLWEKREGKK